MTLPYFILFASLLAVAISTSQKCFQSSCSCTHFSSADVALLESFKSHVTNDPKGVLSNWNKAKTCTNGWNGVCCDSSGNVVEIYLPHAKLTGSIPSSIGGLRYLESLELSDNIFAGLIPPSLGNLTRLKLLYLDNNKFSGYLSSSLGRLSKLQILDFFNNSISGSIPSSFGSLRSLQFLGLTYNRMGGSIPSSIGSLSALQELQLGFNTLSGYIPSELGKLSKLRYLDLSSNKLKGTIPPSFGNLTSLQQLLLTNNFLEGGLPSLKTICTSSLPNSFNASLNCFSSAMASGCSIGTQKKKSVCNAFYSPSPPPKAA